MNKSGTYYIQIPEQLSNKSTLLDSADGVSVLLIDHMVDNPSANHPSRHVLVSREPTDTAPKSAHCCVEGKQSRVSPSSTNSNLLL